ncbi:hypothetical protein AVEN_170170-1 [Araneus ventricosus]|uniref:Uncharacterized protein n=1 Tax=Araneus ventricosus TaxID=182803 RepID=A0A4Y2UFS1_ARAVE|nr:hypothetical protein AVEN_170170-1 [Araneus ventricosus]
MTIQLSNLSIGNNSDQISSISTSRQRAESRDCPTHTREGEGSRKPGLSHPHEGGRRRQKAGTVPPTRGRAKEAESRDCPTHTREGEGSRKPGQRMKT